MRKIVAIKSIVLPGLLMLMLLPLIAGCTMASSGQSDGLAQELDNDMDQTGALTEVSPTPVAEQTEVVPSPTLSETLTTTGTVPAVGTPLPAPTEPPTDESEMPQDEMADVLPALSFSYDDLLASSIISETIPAQVQFTLDGYPLTDTSHVPQVSLYSVDEYEAMSEAAAEQIATLRELLTEQPETAAGPLPFLPLPLANGSQIITAQIAYLSFQSGTGVRYLSQYGETVVPVNNNELFYTFQGLTDDGRYYISAVFPVSQADLPASLAEVPEGFAEDQEGYLADVVQQLNEAEPAAFSPDLSLLDAAMSSLTINSDVSETTDTNTGGTETEYPVAVASAMQVLSEGISVSPEEVEVVSFDEMEWPDGCLGLGEADELCTQALVSGWLVILRVNGQVYEVRTDETGRNVRWQFTLEPGPEVEPEPYP